MGALLVPLLFIHGIKGAVLTDERGAVRWIDTWQAIGLFAPDLKLPTLWKGRQEKDTLKPAGILERVFYQDVYGPWLKTAKGLNRPFHPFAYDWRRENAEAVEALEAKLVEIGKPVQVVAHSMGGLVTMALLTRRPELFQSVVFAGVPFVGGIGFLPDLHEGVSTGLNSRILSPEVLATFPSVYSLFANAPNALVGETVDFFDAEEWKRLGLGMFRSGRKAPDGFDLFLAEALRRARLFRAQIYGKQMKYPPIAVICGKAHPTLRQARKRGDDWDFDSEPKVPGDGRVQRTHCTPPEGIPYELHEVDLEHAHLLEHPGLTKILEALARRNP